MRVLLTGADGFVGRNLRLHLSERKDVEVICFTKEHSARHLRGFLADVEFVFHMAGVNRPREPTEFVTGNVDLTAALLGAVEAEIVTRCGSLPIIFTSSIQASSANPYGESKRAAEVLLKDFEQRTGSPVHIFRLPNVFGKWSRPNYNSAVATFCHNIARGLPIQVNDASAQLNLVYVDDVVAQFIQIMDGADSTRDTDGFASVKPQYTTTVGDVARLIETFRGSRETLITERVGEGFVRALYSTYLSHLPSESFVYEVPMHADPRGVFVEMLKTPDCGQFSFFTAHPGITRGGHYHHTKNEKFLVIKGEARFKFRHMDTGEIHEIVTSSTKAQIVETVPGWTHDITNIGDDELIVMLWANEIFDRARPDTYACPL
jgi:UDP-2-acetamido-2,6-beta-L-arabino-hexul-4-ose reductase